MYTDGIPIYSEQFSLGDTSEELFVKYKVRIDASTGTVLSSRIDD